MEDNSLNCVITSPPYNVGIDYDVYEDLIPQPEYYANVKQWFSILYDKLCGDGRVALNLPIETNNNGGRYFIQADYWAILKDIGYQWAGYVDLVEAAPQVTKLTAWGSWLSPSAPYVHNAQEGVLLLYKNQWKRLTKGTTYFNDSNKDEFISLTRFGWKYQPETKWRTKANFSLDLPTCALKLLTWEEDIVYDPFMGSGTTAVACEDLGRRWIGSELSPAYYKVASRRIKDFEDPAWKAKLFLA